MTRSNLQNKKVLAIVPARKGSKGLKDKNIKKFAGKPLIYWPIKSAKNSKYINNLIVSTDSKKIRNYCKSINVDVPFLRPKNISKDNSKSIEFIIHALNFLKKKGKFFDYVVLLEPTSPLTTSKDVDKALLKLHKNKKIADSIVGVSENINHHPSYNVRLNKLGMIKPYQKKFRILRRQEIKKLFFYDGSLYISKTDKLIEKKSFYQSRTLAFHTEKWKSIEIDDIIDFITAEALFKNKKKFYG